MSPMIRVQIVEGLALVESGLRALLEAEPDIELVAHSDCSQQCQQQCMQHQPDVLIMDIAVNGLSCLECAREILAKHPEVRILIFTDHRRDEVLRHALKIGAKGYATKRISPDMMMQSVRDVAAGKLFIEPDIARQMILDQTIGDPPPIEKLSAQEYKIMRLLVEGKTIGEISETICLSRNTVANYHSLILQKIGAANDVELTHLAIRHGIVEA